MRTLAALAVLAVVGLLLSGAAAADIAAAPDRDIGDPIASTNQENQPPIADFSHSPTNPEPGQAVVLNASAARDPDGEIISYRWDLDGDGEEDVTGGPNRRVAFPSAGTYNVTLTVVDNDGASNATTHQIVVVGDQPPVARLNVSPTRVVVGEKVTIDATASTDPDGPIESWALDTNGTGTYDQTFDSPSIFRTTYSEPGTYQITLRVTDSDGLTSTTSVEIVVEPRDTPTRTTTSTTPPPTTTTSPPPTTVIVEPDTDTGTLPGGLTLALLALVLLLVAGVVGLVLRGQVDVQVDHSLTSEELTSGPRLGLAIAVVLVLLGLPLLALRGRFAPVEGTDAAVALGVLQLAALAIPAIVLLLAVMVWYPATPGDRSPMEGDQRSTAGRFHRLGIGLAAVSLLLLVIGIATMLLVLAPPAGVTISAGFVLAAVALTPVALVYIWFTAIQR